MTPPKCDSCGQFIWNPEFWEESDMCGPCTTGESATLFHDLWIPPLFDDVNTEAKLLAHWRRWYDDIYKPTQK